MFCYWLDPPCIKTAYGAPLIIRSGKVAVSGQIVASCPKTLTILRLRL